jgi:hypothetical protein
MKKHSSSVRAILADLASTKSILTKIGSSFMVLIILPVTTIGIYHNKSRIQ